MPEASIFASINIDREFREYFDPLCRWFLRLLAFWRWFSVVLSPAWQWNNVCITSSMRIGGHKVRTQGRRNVKIFGGTSQCGMRNLFFDWNSGNFSALIFLGLVLHVSFCSGGPAIKWGWDSPAYTSWYPRFIARPGCPLSQPWVGPGVSPSLAQHSLHCRDHFGFES
jgi:hypothetical protein